MMFKKKLLASAMATALVTGAMLSGGAQAVRMSETSVGQVLLGDMYIARASDYSTTSIKVVNTSTTDAVKAKLVFRSKKHSDECKDMILYLTPGDVAYVDVRLNATTGKPEIWSDDDSILASKRTDGTAVFASQVAGGVTFAMRDLTKQEPTFGTSPSEDTCAQGHFEVVSAYAVTGTVVNPSAGAAVVIKQGMAKHDLIRVFDQTKPALNAAGNNITNDGAARTGADYTARVQLKGNVEIKSGMDRLMAPMLALRDGVNASTAGATTYLVTNPSFDVSLGAETLVGQSFGAAGADTLADIEAALSTTKFTNVYEKAGTNFEVTFPTKYRHIFPQSQRYTNKAAGTTTYESPFYNLGEVAYGVSLFDNQERSAPGVVGDLCVVSPCGVSPVGGSWLIHEVNFELVGGSAAWDPASGWFLMTLGNRAGTDQYGTVWAAQGVPATGYTHFYKAGVTQSVISPMGR
ncbi:MAG: hypothetical protein KGZ83_01940 [Sulfuricella sp.]|nr:hypothetical protein [Sulfuricella sp.]